MKLLNKLGIWVVTLYANRLYKKAVKAADKRHAEEGEMIYVTSNLLDPQQLITCNRRQYREMKVMSGAYRRGKYPIELLKNDGCWYHTGNRSENDCMTPHTKELKRLAFQKMLLRKSGLLKK